MKIRCVLVVFMAFYFCRAEYLKKCLTPSGREGVCKSIVSCRFLKSLATRENISRKEVHYLRQSACGFNKSTPLVCCPEYGPGACAPAAAPPDPWSGCCGITATSYFRKGTSVPAIDQYPWMAIIEYDKDNMIRLLCSGALISSRYVLSTATCFTNKALLSGVPKRVRLGEFDTSNPGPDCVVDYTGENCNDGALVVPIEQAIRHPGHDEHRKLNDVALIRLLEMVPYTDFIRPICLPTMDLTESPPRYLKLYVAGWGATTNASYSNLLRHVGLPLVDSNTCQKAYNQSRRQLTLSSEHVCAGGEPGRDVCRGDSGAPLVYEAGPFVEVLGLVSFGAASCGLRDVPSVYTKVFAHTDWIRKTIRA